jgi:hypothetical protein
LEQNYFIWDEKKWWNVRFVTRKVKKRWIWEYLEWVLKVQMWYCNHVWTQLSDVFLNARQIVTQLVVYLVLSLPLYHSFQTFQFINISPFEKHVFVFKFQIALNELKPNSINIMCSLIINKYINRCSQYESLSLTKFLYIISKKEFQNITNPKLFCL